MSSPRRLGILGFLLASLASLSFASGAFAAAAPVQLGTAGAFGVLGGSTITNTGNSVVNGDLGLHPGTSVTGFPPGIVNGAMHITDAVAMQAKADLAAAYLDAAGRTQTATLGPDLGGSTLVPGVYRTGGVPTLGLTGSVTLDAGGDPNAVWIFQIASSLTTATDSSVNLINGGQSCNVFWQVGASATLGTRTSFRGNVLALDSISVDDAATIDGRLLARNAAVTLINDTISRATCAAGTGGGTGTGTTGTGTGTTGTGTGTTGTGGGGDGGVDGGAGGGDDGAGGGGGGADNTGPIIYISGTPRATGTPRAPGTPRATVTPRCTTRDFVASVALRDAAGIRRAFVFLDGVRLRSTTLTRVALSIRIRGLRIGSHRLTVVAFDRNGNRATSTRAFSRCQVALVAPRFTG